MAVRTLIRKNAYYDSVVLMSVSGRIAEQEGVSDAMVAMATDMNKELLDGIGLLTPAISGCGANDLLIVVRALDETICEQAVAQAEAALSQRAGNLQGNAAPPPATLNAAVRALPPANLVVISVPGAYAAREAWQALRQGLHVMMFSDNVSIEEEKSLKAYAHEAGLLMMGPDCGTAIVNQVGLCFANAVKPGVVGVVGASGTGIQEVTVLLDRYGGGVSQVLGVGGRDLSEAVGGRMMLDCLRALSWDEATKVIVLISKPPAAAVADRILKAARQSGKPMVVCFIGSEPVVKVEDNLYFTGSLEAASRQAAALARGETEAVIPRDDSQAVREWAAGRRKMLSPGQKFIRGLFCGGTLCDEAVAVVGRAVGPVYGNTIKDPQRRLQDATVSQRHSFIDLGDDAFTVGKPHPMIEPGLRLPRLLQEARDPDVAVILLDVLLGYGSHPDPVGVTLPAIEEALRLSREAGRHLEIICYLCGTGQDPQNYRDQETRLNAAGVTLASSNAAAARMAAAMVG